MFDYLKPYVDQKGPVINTWEQNSLWSLDNAKEIEEQEKRLGYSFPYQLKQFWQEIGSGRLTTPHNPPPGWKCGPDNEILTPKELVDIMLLGEESESILPHVVEDYNFEEDMPFFKLGSDCFLIMKYKSENPNAVYDFGGVLIEDSLEQFIHNLYYKSPKYYMENW